MNEKDLRDCFAMFKAVTGASAEDCYRFADAMLEARNKDNDEEELGIAAVKPKRKYLRSGSR
jgi:hypothetical protein